MNKFMIDLKHYVIIMEREIQGMLKSFAKKRNKKIFKQIFR